MTSNTDESELCDRYEALYPGAVTDVMDDRALENQIMDPAIAPITKDMTVAGIAYPVVGRTNGNVDPEENIRNILKMLGDAPPNSVITTNANDDSAAHIGELSTTALQAGDVRGAVIDGGARDVAKILEMGFPVFRKFHTPADAVPRWEILDWNVETTVGGVHVIPGDIIIGDVDGVAVVPRDLRDEILQEAEEIVETEDHVRKAVQENMNPLEAYEKYGKF